MKLFKFCTLLFYLFFTYLSFSAEVFDEKVLFKKGDWEVVLLRYDDRSTACIAKNGLGNKENPLLAFKWMKKAAESGHPLAQHGLGFMYMEGDCTEQNGELAVKWFSKAADQGLTGSLTTLALMYEEGKIVEKDPVKAKEYLKRAGF